MGRSEEVGRVVFVLELGRVGVLVGQGRYTHQRSHGERCKYGLFLDQGNCMHFGLESSPKICKEWIWVPFYVYYMVL